MGYLLLSLYLLTLSLTLPLEARFDPDMEKLHIEMGDVAQGLKVLRVDLNLLEERLRKQDKLPEVAALEKKIAELEKGLERASTDVRTLNNSLKEAILKIQVLETKIGSHDQRLGEVTKLKDTLNLISKAIGKTKGAKTYLVKPGDSLEKIAKMHQISVEALRKNNQLTQDKIFAGQELRLEP